MRNRTSAQRVGLWPTACGAFLVAQADQPLLQRLDPATRAKVLVGLAGVLLLGLVGILLVWLAGRVARAYANRTSAVRPRWLRADLREDDWAKKPLAPAEEAGQDDQ